MWNSKTYIIYSCHLIFTVSLVDELASEAGLQVGTKSNLHTLAVQQPGIIKIITSIFILDWYAYNQCWLVFISYSVTFQIKTSLSISLCAYIHRYLIARKYNYYIKLPVYMHTFQIKTNCMSLYLPLEKKNQRTQFCQRKGINIG